MGWTSKRGAKEGGGRVFRYKKSVPVSYDRQGYIYFMSRLYQELPKRQQERIISLCQRCGGEHGEAVFDFVTGSAGAEAVCARYYLSRSTLERAVREYYRAFPLPL